MNIQVKAKQYTSAAEMMQEAKRLRDRFYRPEPKKAKVNVDARADLLELREKLSASERLVRDLEQDVENAEIKINSLERLLDFMRGELARFAGDVASVSDKQHETELFRARPTIKDMCCEVLRNFPGVTFLDLLGESRNFYVVEARHACIYEIKKRRPEISFPMIGRALNRDHTTILHAYKKMQRLEAMKAKEAAE